MEKIMIEAAGLHKSFGETHALRGLDFDVREGTILGMLGPNGAGKTTAVRILTTLTHPNSGKATVAGIDVLRHPDQVRARIGVAGQYAALDELLTGRENLGMIGRLYRLDAGTAKRRADDLLERFELTDAADRTVKTYSGGMRRRLDLGAALIAEPPVVFLDEPTTGLDPRSRNQVWEIIRTLVAEGTTILLCTQYLDEADQLAEGIAVIDHGKVIAEGTPSQLKASVGSGALHVRLLDPEQRPEAERVLEQALDAVHLEADPAALSAACADATRAAEAVAELARAGVQIADFSLGQPSLDEVFLALTGHPAEEQGPEEAIATQAEHAA